VAPSLSIVIRRSALATAIGAVVLPLGYTPREGLSTSAAYCQNGTCCPEDGAFCIVGDIQVKNYYYKSSGTCKVPPPDA